MVEKPWNLLGMSKTRYYATRSDWGKEGLTKKQYLQREKVSPYHWKKLKMGEQMRAQQAREAAKAAAASSSSDAAAAAAASQKPGGGRKRTLPEAEEEEYGEEYDDDHDDDHDESGSIGRDGAPSPDSDGDYIP